MNINHRLILFALIASVQAVVRADSVTLSGSPIAMPDCTIESVSADMIGFRDSRGRLHRRPSEDIASLGFDGLEQLDEAERLSQGRHYAHAIPHFASALLDARNNSQRLWIHARLTKTHDLIGDRTLAIAHFANVIRLDPDRAWMRLEPVCKPDRPTWAESAEAMHAVNAAERAASRDRVLGDAIRSLRREIRPVHEQLRAAYDGPEIDPGGRISGLSPADIRLAVRTSPAPAPRSDPPPENNRRPQLNAPRSTQQPTLNRNAPQVSETAKAIARLLEAGKNAEAIESAERALSDGDIRAAGSVLFHYGRALEASDRPLDAAVAFTQCGLVHSHDPHAAAALLAAANIHENELGDADAARRLRLRAQALTPTSDQSDEFKR